METAVRCPDVLGARMTGAGFGGCAIVLLKDEAVAEIKRRLGEHLPAADGGSRTLPYLRRRGLNRFRPLKLLLCLSKIT